MELRRCCECKKLWPWPALFIQCKGKYRGTCKICHGRAAKAYRKANPEKVREYHRKYYQEHKEQFRCYKRAERARNEQ